MCSKFTGEYPREKVISIKLLQICRTPFNKTTSGEMLIYLCVFATFCFSHNVKIVVLRDIGCVSC